MRKQCCPETFGQTTSSELKRRNSIARGMSDLSDESITPFGGTECAFREDRLAATSAHSFLLEPLFATVLPFARPDSARKSST